MKKAIRIALSGLLVLALTLSGFGAALAATVRLPASLTVLGAEAFRGDTSLDDVVIPEGVREIRDRCFANSSLKSIHIPASVTTIAANAFSGTNPRLLHRKPRLLRRESERQGHGASDAEHNDNGDGHLQ